MDSKSKRWITKGFDGFSRGTFVNAGDNLYVTARGYIETIHRFDLNNDGYVDIVLPNEQGFNERGPTWIYKQEGPDAYKWPRIQLPNDSGTVSRAVDVDGDGYLDLVVVNGENGVTSELDSYVYWGGPGGLTGERTELPTAGAYDVVVVDINNDGLNDIIFPSAWLDHHNRGVDRLCNVYIQKAPRQFEDRAEDYGLIGNAAKSISCGDLNKDGYPDIVLANYVTGHKGDTTSYIYWGSDKGYSKENRTELPTNHAGQVTIGDLDNDGFEEVVFCGGGAASIYWNDKGSFDAGNVTVIKGKGDINTDIEDFNIGAGYVGIADVNGDGLNELVISHGEGIEIRSSYDIQKVETYLKAKGSGYLYIDDLDNDGYPDIIVCRNNNGKTYETESSIFWNSVNGFDINSRTLIPTTGASGCCSGDLDGDGIPEIIFNNTAEGYCRGNKDFPAYVYLGDEHHGYSVENRLELPNSCGGGTYVMTDIDQDGYTDLLLTAPEGCRIFWGGPKGPRADNYTSVLKPKVDHRTISMNVYVADFNKDGWLDIMIGMSLWDESPRAKAESTCIFYGSAQGFSQDHREFIPAYCWGSLHVADVNEDGWLDIIYGDKKGFLMIYFGSEKGYSVDRSQKIPLKGTDESEASISRINSADLNGNGWLDLVVSLRGHWTRAQSGFYILYGGPEGYSTDNIEFHPMDATPTYIAIADINKDGELDLLVPAYSTQFTRELPAYIFYGKNGSFDYQDPLVIPCEAACSFTAVDTTDNGYVDVIAVCHRNDIGHRVNSLLFKNGPDGLDIKHPELLPGMGPHGMTTRDFGNRKDRRPVEYYESAIENIKGRIPSFISWKSETPANTQLLFQLRWGRDMDELKKSSWRGPEGEDSYYSKAGTPVEGIPDGMGFLQYRAGFVSTNGCSSPKLYEVRIDFH